MGMSIALARWIDASPRTQADLAREWEVDRVTVNRWKKGKRKIAPRLVPLVSRTTGIPIAELRPDLLAVPQ